MSTMQKFAARKAAKADGGAPLLLPGEPPPAAAPTTAAGGGAPMAGVVGGGGGKIERERGRGLAQDVALAAVRSCPHPKCDNQMQ